MLHMNYYRRLRGLCYLKEDRNNHNSILERLKTQVMRKFRSGTSWYRHFYRIVGYFLILFLFHLAMQLSNCRHFYYMFLIHRWISEVKSYCRYTMIRILRRCELYSTGLVNIPTVKSVWCSLKSRGVVRY